MTGISLQRLATACVILGGMAAASLGQEQSSAPLPDAPQPGVEFNSSLLPSQSPLGATDAYGNAQFDLPDRRPLGIFQNSAEYNALGAYQMLDRDRRGGSSIFSLPGELLGLRTIATLTDTASPSIMADVSRERRIAFNEYGGFGVRFGPANEDAITNAFERRTRLIEATGTYAPIYRAIMRNSALSGLRPAALNAPFMEKELVHMPNVDSGGNKSLYQLLQSDAENTFEKTMREAWLLLEEGEFRQAAYAFESAGTLEPNSQEARLGEIFGYVANGSIRTAAVLLRRFVEDGNNPFALDVKLAERLADEEFVRSLIMQGRLTVESGEALQNVDYMATEILILWHLGDRETAERGANTLIRGTDTAPYVDWPAKMRAARAGAEPGR